jgi:hypothetical protein
MMSDDRWHAGLIAALRLEPPFNAARMASVGARGPGSRHGDVMVDHSNGRDAVNTRQLTALLQSVGVDANTAACACFAKDDAVTARAAANIADWLTYLPTNCVQSMVKDGWHWST